MSKKLQALTSHLIGTRQCRKENIDSWIDRCQIRQETSDEGLYQQLHLDHNACTVFIENFSGNGDTLRAQISAWLQDNDDTNIRERYGLPDPEIDITPMDKSGKKWDVDIAVEFLDPVLVKPDENGDVIWDGLRWSIIDDPIVDTATDEDGVEPSADKEPSADQEPQEGDL